MGEQQWYVQVMGQATGPIAPAELVQMASSGRLSPGDPVRHGEGGHWVDAASVKGLFSGEQKPVAPPPPVKVTHKMPLNDLISAAFQPTSSHGATTPYSRPAPDVKASATGADFLGMNFETYLTPWIVRGTWGLLMMGAAITVLWLLRDIALTAWGENEGDHLDGSTIPSRIFSDLLVIAAVPIALLWARVVLESLIVVFNVARSLASIDGKTKG